nr:hypothetical protein JVH1_3325 [Rhodococcus sp. JVH1]
MLYDANVLYPNVLRDVLIRLAQTGLVHARWTDRILDETFENLAEDRPDIPTGTLTKLRELVNRAVPDSPGHRLRDTHPRTHAAG